MADRPSAARALFERDEVRDVLEASFYRSPVVDTSASDVGPRARRRARKPKPDHYDVICISMYVEDLRALDAKVRELKQRGHRRMTRSALIRYALERLSVDDVPRPAL